MSTVLKWRGILFATISLPIIAILWFSFHYYLPMNNNLSEGTTFYIKYGQGAHAVGQELKKQGIIRQSTPFTLICRITGADRQLHRGRYILSQNMDIPTILRILQEKEGTASLVQVTIPEGLSLRETAQLFDEHGGIPAEIFLRFALQPSAELVQKYPFLQGCSTLEGFLYPETYTLAYGTDIDLIINNILSQFETNIFSHWQKGNNHTPLNFRQALILASIIELEAVEPVERDLISGVYHQRLQYNMYLDSCPTVKYALGNLRLPMVTYKDLEVDSPFNTYRHYGLPPAPICSPGQASFIAAMNPEKSNYLYFFAKGDGSHVFSRSLQEHNRLRQVLGR